MKAATPSPYGNFLEDRMSLNLSVSATLDNAYRVGVSYTDFFGGGIRNKATDHACAASIVADVMGKHGVTESAVAKIWTRLGKNIDVLFRTT